MTGLAMMDLQTSVMEVLKDDAPLGVLTGNGVYDGVAPSSKVMPYVLVDSWMEVPKDIHNRTGRDVTFRVHIYSKQNGFKEAKIIGSRVADLLDLKGTIPVEDWSCWRLAFDNAFTVIEPPENHRHVILQFKASLQEGIYVRP